MAIISGVDFYRGQLANGTTSGTGLADMVERDVRFMIAKVGQAHFYDSAWTTHKNKMLALGGVIQKGAYWFLEADTPRGLVPGYFYPPWPQGLTFVPRTYGTAGDLTGHSNYSVDWNKGTGGDDLGINVLAAAAGTVVGTVGGGYGEVTINHVGGYATQYLHMRDITVSASDTVFRGQKIGEISNKHPTATLSPHLHHVHFRNGARIKQRILDVPCALSLSDSDTGNYGVIIGKEKDWVTGRMLNADQPVYTGATQADLFLAGLNAQHDPTGWFCAIDVESAPTEEYGVSAKWGQVRQFADEFWRQAPGYPLFIYTSKGIWNGRIKGADGNPIDAREYGFAGLWTADWTQLSGVYASNFQEKVADLSFQGGYAGGYAGFQKSRIIQYGTLHFSVDGDNRQLDGNAFDGTLANLKALSVGTGDPGGTGLVPNLYNVVEATALTQLTAAGLTAGTRTEAYHLTVVAGRVIRTDPPSGTTVDAGSAVAYVVSLGPRATTTVVPYIVDEEEDAGLADLTAVGLVAGTRTTATSVTIALDRIISTTPVAGTVVAASSSVAYVVSLGPPGVTAGFDPAPPSPCE